MRIPTRAALLALAIASSVPAPAQPPSSAPMVVSQSAGDTADAPTWLDRLETFATGRAVIAAGPVWYDAADGKPFRKTDRFSETVAEFARRAGTDEPLAVFTLRGAWVLAPATREEVRTDYAGVSAMEASSRGLLLDTLLTSLTEEQSSRLGTDEGLPIASLSPAQRALLEGALRPPLQVDRTGPDAEAGEESAVTSKVERVDAPLDLSRGSLRARLEASASVPMLGPEAGSQSVSGAEDGAAQYSVDRAGWMDETDPFTAADIPSAPDVPNSRKPSDLDGRKFTAPIAMSGQATVEDVVSQLANVTGLRLYVDAPYRDMPAFLGSRALTAGQVMDGLCLALTAAWRKVGPVYVVAWDRRGVGALKQLVAESTAGLVADVERRSQTVQSSPVWARLAHALPFAPDDPLALTDDQRRRLLDPAEGEIPEIPFAEMTPSQKDFLRQLVKRDVSRFTMDGSPGPSRGGWVRSDGRPLVYPEDTLKEAGFFRDIRVDLSVNTDRYGWVRLPTRQSLATDGMYGLPNGVETIAGAAEPAAPPVAMPRLVSAPVRGLMVPPLEPDGLEALAAGMERAGLNVLFYPALARGYATFPSAAFPPDPVLQGADGLAAAVSAMAKHGIRVVATVDVLAWRAGGSEGHWLLEHPGWLDVDIAGRTRLEWLAKHPDSLRRLAGDFARLAGTPDAPNVQMRFGAAVLGDALRPADYVRPREPAVRRKLADFVDELTKRDGLAGIALDGWKPASQPGLATAPPALGYAVPERLAALAKGRRDPVDVATVSGPPYPRIFGDEDFWNTRAEPRDGALPKDPHDTLVTDLLRRAGAARPEWKSWLVAAPAMPWAEPWASDSRPHPLPVPHADFTLVVDPLEGSADPAALLSVWPSSLAGSVPDLAAVRGLPPLTWLNRTLGGPKGTVRKAMVFDLRAAPDEISDALRWLNTAPPNSAPVSPRPDG